MNIYHIIDSGNTNLKLATMSENGQVVSKEIFNSLDELNLYLSHNQIKEVISCSVNLDIVLRNVIIHHFNDYLDKLNFKTNYSNSLGIDRTAISFFVQKIFNTERCAIVNAGSFTTVDFIENDLHLGGYIFPGCQNYLNIYKNGRNLPVLDIRQFDIQNISIAQNTYEAILNSLAIFNHSILQMIKDRKFKIILTGGNAQYFEGLGFDLKKDDDLLFKSLFYIFSSLMRDRN